MFPLIRLVAVIAVSMFLGFAFVSAVGEGSWRGPWPFAYGARPPDIYPWKRPMMAVNPALALGRSRW